MQDVDWAGTLENWQIERTTYKVSDFLTWQRSQSLILSPSFQRRSVWEAGAKSYLVDTVLRGLPMPIIFLRDLQADLKTYETKREVVDGQQRIRTLISYIAPQLLPDYDVARDRFTIKKTHNAELAGKGFADLPADLRQRILDYQFSVHVFPADTDDRMILQIFARMNSTGISLNKQELRNAKFFGEFKTTVYTLATGQLPRWRDWGIFSEHSIARMLEVELTSDFVVVMLQGIMARNAKVLDTFYAKYDSDFAERDEVAKRFTFVMDSISDRLEKNVINTFRSVTLFYGLFAVFYDIHFGIDSSLLARKPRSIRRINLTWLGNAGAMIIKRTAPEDVVSAYLQNTTNLDSRARLYSYLRNPQNNQT